MSVVPAWNYADTADVFADAPVIARLRTVRAIALKSGTPDVATRFYVEATVVALIRAPSPLPATVRYLAQPLPDSRGKLPKLAKAEMLVAARLAAPGDLQLVAVDGQRPWSPAFEAQVRALAGQSSAPDAPPRITGVSSAFHVAGTVDGESETQLFLDTASGRPASLSVLRRPGVDPSWSVAFGDVVDERAPTPLPETLGWYRLACFLPRVLPATATAEASPPDAEAAAADYAFVLDRLGPCPRTRAQK